MKVQQVLLQGLAHTWRAQALMSHQALKAAACGMHSASGAPISSEQTAARPGSGLRRLLAVVGTLGLTGGAYLAQAGTKESPEATKPPEDPYQKPKELYGLPASFTLYQYEVCPFCCKVKAFLDYHKLPYKVVEVNPLTKGELKWSTYRKVPVLQWDDAAAKVEVDSSAIMSRLSAELSSLSSKQLKAKGLTPPANHSSTAAAQEEEKWRKWVDARFVKVITANIYRSWDESLATFKYITTQTNWSWGTREAARWSGAVLMWQVGKRMPAKYNIEGDLREALYKDCNEWVDTLAAKKTPYLGGQAPGLADLAVYGVLKAVWHTPTFEDAMAHSRIKPWFDRMDAVVGQPVRVE